MKLVFGVPCWDGILPFAVFSLFPCWSQKEEAKTGNAYSVGDPPGKRKFPFLHLQKLPAPLEHTNIHRGAQKPAWISRRRPRVPFWWH